MRLLILVALCLGLAAQPASASDLDGRWTGVASQAEHCVYAATVTVQVAGDAVHGTSQNPGVNASIRGEVDSGGSSATLMVEHHLRGTLRLIDGHMVIDWTNNACHRHAELQRDMKLVPGRFDGAWQAERLAMAKPCNASTYLRLVVAGSSVIGELYAPWHDAMFTATIGPDGTGRLEMEGAHGSIQFQGDRFQIAWVGGRCGSEVALGDRAPDAARRQAMLQIRQQNQQALKALIDRAGHGDAKVDYTALRAAAVQADDWAFYNNKADTVMQLAAEEAKGGDCAQALDNLAQAIRYDFTMDTAHALKADCLRKRDPRTAKIEDGIANGLVRSLMRSGDGAREKTAYVVTTGREIADVLANRKIQIRTRQHEVRGSDGHYYAVVQGLSVDKKGNHVRDVYFNVDAFVLGRQSRRVAGTADPATMH